MSYKHPAFDTLGLAAAPDCRFEPAPADFVLPDGFLCTTNFPTYVKVGGRWRMPEHPRMGSHVGWSPAADRLEVREMRLVRKGDLVPIGEAEDGIPIGSVIVHRGRIIGRGHNRRVQRGSAILHAEMDALESAGRQPASVYREAVLYTTLSPCAMCSGAILLYGIPKVVIGENQTFTGEEALLRSRGVEVEVLQEAACVELMRSFIAKHPILWNEDIGVT